MEVDAGMIYALITFPLTILGAFRFGTSIGVWLKNRRKKNNAMS